MKNNLKKYRLRHGHTLKELSDICGVGKTSLHDLEKQDGAVPKISTAYKICKAFNCSVYAIWIR